MVWYIIAVVMVAGSTEPNYKMNNALQFKNLTICNEYRKRYSKGLEESLRRNFPEIQTADIQCIDQDSAMLLQDEMLRKERK